jgi:hypothetical protein
MATERLEPSAVILDNDAPIASETIMSAEPVAPSVVTPVKILEDDDNHHGNVPPTKNGSQSDSDTCSETSVASSSEAFEGKKKEPKNKDDELAKQKDSGPHCVTPTNATAPENLLKSPPRKTNRVSLTAAAFDRPTPVSPSSSSAAISSAARRTHTGLSELSKQLRVLQAKNQHLQAEMERSQRQLNIMSESKGVSVGDLLTSLENACAKEAHAELQSQVSSLEAQLDALRMSAKANSPSRGGADARTVALQRESLQQQIAALQLQVGEYEEIEAKLKTEMKSLYAQVQTHQTKALTLEARCDQQQTMLEAEQARTKALEEQVADLKLERDALKVKQTQRMKAYWIDTLDQQKAKTETRDDSAISYLTGVKNASKIVGRPSLQRSTSESELIKPDAKATVTKYWKPSRLPRSFYNIFSDDDKLQIANDKASPTTNTYVPSILPRFYRTNSESDLMLTPDARATVTNNYVPYMLSRFSQSWDDEGSARKISAYDCSDDAHRAQLYVKQSARAWDLQTLCQHQQQSLQQLQEEQLRDQARAERLELEKSAAQAKRNALEQQIHGLELNLRLEQEKVQSLESQLANREEEFTLKKDQLQSRLQVHKERTVDVEGQLASLYVAYELLQEDRSEEQAEQAELRGRLIDADSLIARQISQQMPAAPSTPQEDEALAQQLGRQERQNQETQDASDNMSVSSNRSFRQRVGSILAPSPRRSSGSRRGLFGRSKSNGSLNLPPAPPLASITTTSSTRRASTNSIPPRPPTNTVNAARLARAASSNTPSDNNKIQPAVTVHKGFLLQQQPKKKKLLREKPEGWKRKYFVLKQGQGQAAEGSYCLWYGDVPNGKVKGTIPHLIRGLSTLTMVPPFSDKPHSFSIHLNPRDPKAPVFLFAAESASDYEAWTDHFKAAIDVDFSDLTAAEQSRANVQMTVAMADKYAA